MFFGRKIAKRSASENIRPYPEHQLSIITNDIQRFSSMLTALKGIGEIKKRNGIVSQIRLSEQDLDHLIIYLKKLSWLTMELSDTVKYSAPLVKKYISEEVWRILTPLAKALNYTAAKVDHSILLGNPHLFMELEHFEGALKGIIEGRRGANTDPSAIFSLSVLKQITDPYLDHNYLQESLSCRETLTTLDLSKYEHRAVALRIIEIVGETAKNLSESVKSKFNKIPYEELQFLRNRIQHPEDTDASSITIINIRKLIENEGNCLKDICDDVNKILVEFEHILTDQQQNDDLEFTNTDTFVGELRKEQAKKSLNSSDLSPSEVDALITLTGLHAERTALCKIYKIFFIKDGYQEVSEDEFKQLLISFHKAEDRDLLQAYQNIKTKGYLTSEEKQEYFQNIPGLKQQLLRNKLKSYFEKPRSFQKKAKEPFPNRADLTDLLNELAISPSIRDCLITHYDSLKELAEKYQISANDQELILDDMIQENNVIQYSSEFISYLEKLFNNQLKHFARSPVTQNDFESLEQTLKEKQTTILQWLDTQDVNTDLQQKASSALEDLRSAFPKNNIPYSLAKITNKEALLCLPGYPERYLREILNGEYKNIALENFLLVLKANKVNLENYISAKPFYEAYRKIKKLPSYENAISKLRQALIEFRNLAKSTQLPQNPSELSKMHYLQVEYHLEVIARYAEDLLDQPELLTKIFDHVTFSELSILKEFRNGLAHRPYATDRHRLSYFSDTCLLYMVRDLDNRLQDIETQKAILPQHRKASSVETIEDMRKLIYDNRKEFIDIITEFSVSYSDLKIIGRINGCDLGPQRSLTLSVQFIGEASDVNLFLLESRLSAALGIEVLAVIPSQNTQNLQSELTEQEFKELITSGISLSDFLQAESHYRIYQNNPETLFSFQEENRPRRAQNAIEAAQAIGADNFALQNIPGQALVNYERMRKLFEDSCRILSTLEGDSQTLKSRSLYEQYFCADPGRLRAEQLISYFGSDANLIVKLPTDWNIGTSIIEMFVFTLEDMMGKDIQHSAKNISAAIPEFQPDNNIYIDFLKNLMSIRNDVAGQNIILKGITHQIKEVLDYIQHEYPHLSFDGDLLDQINNFKRIAKNTSDYVLERFANILFELRKKQRDCHTDINNYLDINGKYKSLYNNLNNCLVDLLLGQPPLFLALEQLIRDNLSALGNRVEPNDIRVRWSCFRHMRERLKEYIPKQLRENIEKLAEDLIQSGNFYSASSLVLYVPIADYDDIASRRGASNFTAQTY